MASRMLVDGCHVTTHDGHRSRVCCGARHSRRQSSRSKAHAADGRKGTYSLPVQNVLASLASHATTPRSSSGRPRRPSGFRLAHLSSRCGCVSRYAAVMLYIIMSSASVSRSGIRTSVTSQFDMGKHGHQPRTERCALEAPSPRASRRRWTPGLTRRPAGRTTAAVLPYTGMALARATVLQRRRRRVDGEPAKNVSYSLCVNVARAEGVDPDALRTELAGHAAAHLDDGRLGRVV